MADAARSPAWLALAGEISSFMAHLLEMIMGPVADDLDAGRSLGQRVPRGFCCDRNQLAGWLQSPLDQAPGRRSAYCGFVASTGNFRQCSRGDRRASQHGNDD